MLQGNFFTITDINVEPGSVKAVLEINDAHEIFNGHFPGTPVVPGVCMMQMVKEVIEDVAGKETKLVRADHMKFLTVINPNENKLIQLDAKYTIAENKKISVVASLFNNSIIYFKFKGLLIVK
jgi:3-hydroxyacyl-[acyl-carrier-protein] dehydratase